jgi:hypothetical protein
MGNQVIFLITLIKIILIEVKPNLTKFNLWLWKPTTTQPPIYQVVLGSTKKPRKLQEAMV